MSTGSETRARLVNAACRAFAEHGVHNASLLDITRQAGQRNRGAVHYHFQSRERLLAAVLELQIGSLTDRQAELLEVARSRPDDLTSAVEAIVLPTVEIAERGWRGRCFLVIVGELVEEDPDSLGPEVSALLASTGTDAIVALLSDLMPPLKPDMLAERFSLTTNFVIQSVANRARHADLTAPRRPPLPAQDFVDNLVAMVSSMLTAPASP